MKGNRNEFIERIIDIYYVGSLNPELTKNGYEGLDMSLESKVISHFCTGAVNEPFSELIQVEELTDWLIYKRNLLEDEEAQDMYYILLNIYKTINNIN